MKVIALYDKKNATQYDHSEYKKSLGWTHFPSHEIFIGNWNARLATDYAWLKKYEFFDRVMFLLNHESLHLALGRIDFLASFYIDCLDGKTRGKIFKWCPFLI